MSAGAQFPSHHEREIYQRGGNYGGQLKAILGMIRCLIDKPTRAIFIPAAKSRAILHSIIENIREFSTILGDASRIHTFNSILATLSKMLVPVTPSRLDFQDQMKSFDCAVQECEKDLVEEQATCELLRRFRRSPALDREMELLSTVRKNIQAFFFFFFFFFFAQGAADSARAARLPNAIEEHDVLVSCINQLQPKEIGEVPVLKLLPFFRGQSVETALDPFSEQLEILGKWFSDVQELGLFGTRSGEHGILGYCHDFFCGHPHQLLLYRREQQALETRLRIISNAHSSVDILLKLLAPAFSNSAVG
jgi:hypothetical protein